MAQGIYLNGVENNEDGYGVRFNWILSNGDRSTQRDKGKTYSDYMIPADALNKIRRVAIHYLPNECIRGFSFFDKDGALLWEHGWIQSWLKQETVEIAENEKIIGVKAKLLTDDLSIYTDFQFLIGKM